MVAALGVASWVAAVIVLPAPTAARIFLAAPLVIVPRLLSIHAGRDMPIAGDLRRLGGWPALLAALPLIPAFAVAPGPLAALSVVPWLCLAGACGLGTAVRLARRPHVLLQRERAPESLMDAAIGSWTVGAIFLLLDRLAVAPLGLTPEIVLLTAVHFHVLGFGLLSIAGDRRVAAARRMRTAAGLVLVVGIAITATGFNTGSEAVNWIGAVVVGAGGVLMAAGLVAAGRRTSGPRGASLIGAGLALVVGAPMGTAWATAIVFDIAFIDLETMVRTHGVLNGVSVLVAALAWPTGDPP